MEEVTLSIWICFSCGEYGRVFGQNNPHCGKCGGLKENRVLVAKKVKIA